MTPGQLAFALFLGAVGWVVIFGTVVTATVANVVSNVGAGLMTGIAPLWSVW